MSDWISVKDELPNADTIVRVKYASGEGVGSLHEDTQGRKWLQALNPEEPVTHWKPLQEAEGNWMDASWFLNVAGLVLTTIAAALMYYFPPRVEQYTDEGAREVAFVNSATAEGKVRAKRNQCMSKLAPAMLVVGFLLQLVAH
jgi:hypothetical protein